MGTTVRDLAMIMGIPHTELISKLRAIGFRIEGDETHIETDVIQAISQGKMLPTLAPFPPPTLLPLGALPRTRGRKQSRTRIEEPVSPKRRHSSDSSHFYHEMSNSYPSDEAAEQSMGEVDQGDPSQSELIRQLSRASERFVTLGELGSFEDSLGAHYQQIIRPLAPPAQLVHVVGALNAEVLRHLKRHPNEIHRLSPRQFEEFIAEVLASYGWKVQLTPETKDGGYDIFAINKDGTGLETAWLVECKKYRSDRPVGIEIVRSFWAVKTDLRVPNGLIATTSYFTKGAEQFKASRYDLALRDFESIVDWINCYRPHSDGRLYVRDHCLVIDRNTPNKGAAPDGRRRR